MFKSQAIKDLEEKIYEKIAKEIENDDIQKGLWIKAKAETSGDENQIESRYIKLRFDQLKEKSIAHQQEKVKEEQERNQKEEAESAIREAEIKEEEKKKKKLGAGFSAFVWIFSFVIIWSNIDWAKSVGFDSSEEATQGLTELLTYSVIHIISIFFVLARGKKIDRQTEYLEGVKPKRLKSSFNIRLLIVLLLIGIIVWTISPIFNNSREEDVSVFINDVVEGTSNSENQELVSVIRNFRDSMSKIEQTTLPNTMKLLDSDYLEYSSYSTIMNVRRIKDLSDKASQEQLRLPLARNEVVSEFIAEVKNSTLSLEEKNALIERIAKPLSEETMARIVASEAYYDSIYDLYNFLEIEYYNYKLERDTLGGFEIIFSSEENTRNYNELIEQLNIKAAALDVATSNENSYIQSGLDSSGIDMTTEEFIETMYGN